MQPTQVSVKIETGKSKTIAIGGLVISVKESDHQFTELVIGRPGLRNLAKVLGLGDAVLYETPTDGLIEVRAMEQSQFGPTLLVTLVTPRLGFTAGLEPNDRENVPFASDEVAKIRDGVARIGKAMASRQDLTSAQLELLLRKLDEIASAAQRLGRKDWVMYAAGNLTNVCVAAAFSPEAAKDLLANANTAWGWVFHNALRLLS